MKAIRLHEHGGPEVLRYEDVPDPQPGPGQVLIRVEAASVNYADTMRRRNDPYPYPSPAPFIPGGEVAGVVEALGPGVESPKAGTAAFATVGQGGSEGYAQFALANAQQVIPIPPGLDAVQACALIVAGVTAVLTIRDAGRLQRGESVLIQAAAGGVGGYAVQLAKPLGAGTVVAAAGSERKRALALNLGADHAVDYTRDGWTDEVRRLTNGAGADVILDMAGGRISKQSPSALAPFGRMVVYGLASRESVSFDPMTILAPNQSIVGFYLGGWFGPKMMNRAIDALQTLVGHVAAGRVKIQIDRVMPLSQAAEAHRLIEARETTGKIVLLPWADA